MSGIQTRTSTVSLRGLGVIGALAAVSATLALLPASAMAAPPANDNFANAQNLGNATPVSVTGANVDATVETNEPDHADEPGGHSVWYSWTAPADGTVVVDTCESDFDTLLAVYTGATLTGLSEVASDDQGCDDQSRVVFSANSGTIYRIAVDGWEGDTGNIDLDLEVATPPANDNFAAAQDLGNGATAHATGSNLAATKEPPDEPNHAGNPGGHSVWYSWTAPANGTVVVDTCDSSFDTLLAVYTGATLSGLSPVASNDEACGSQSALSFTAAMGTTYKIAVDGWGGEAGDIDFDIGPTPANDDFADAQDLGSDTTVHVTGSNVGASDEPNEPAHTGEVGGRSVWYEWTAPAAGTLIVDVCDSQFDVLIAAYTGTTLGGLTEVGAGFCLLEAPVESGTTYKIAVDGFEGDMGSIDLDLSVVDPPANDDFADAQDLGSGVSAHASGTNVAATLEPNEPNHAEGFGNHSVWYRWTAPSDGTATLEVCDSDFDTVLGVYTGTTLAGLSDVASNDDACEVASEVVFTATGGTIYRIAVDGFEGESGNIDLDLDLESAGPGGSDEAAPQSFIDKVKVKSAKGKAKVKFHGVDPAPASEPLSFECKLDRKPYKACRSPKTFKHLDHGKHKVKVRTTDAEGNTDPTPAKAKFKIKG